MADFAVESFAAVVLAAVAAAALSRGVFDDQPFLALPAFRISSVAEYMAYAVLELLAAVVGCRLVTHAVLRGGPV